MITARQRGDSWGKAVVKKLTADLQKEFPGVQGYSVQNLWYMRQFYIEYSGKTKLQPLVGEISWAKNLVIMGRCKDDLEREFYIRMTRKMGWTKNVLTHQIENKSYEKTLLNQTNFNQTLPETITIKGRPTLCRRVELKPDLGLISNLIPNTNYWLKAAPPFEFVRYSGLLSGPGSPDVVQEIIETEGTGSNKGDN